MTAAALTSGFTWTGQQEVLGENKRKRRDASEFSELGESLG